MLSRSFSMIFVFCLAFLVFGARANPELTNVTVIEGQTLQLNCSFLSSSFSGRTVFWKRDGVQQTPEQLSTYLASETYAAIPSGARILYYVPQLFHFTVHVDGNATQFTLILLNATPTDERRYSCQSDDNKVYVTYAVDVHGPPRNVQVDPLHAVADEGDRVQFRCRASGNPVPRLAWFDKNGNELPSTNGVANFTASVEVSGSITCRAENGYGNAINKTVILAVRYKPRIAVADRWTVKLGMSLRLTCTIISEPASNAYWLKGRQVISEADPSYTLEKVQSRSPDNLGWQLVLKKTALQQNDLGEYTCHANNSIGASHGTTLVTDLPFNSSITTEEVGSTQARLNLVTFAVKPVYFVLTIQAINSTKDPKEWRLHAKGNWPESAAAAAQDAERRDGEAAVARVENSYCVQGLEPTSLYHIVMVVQVSHRDDEKSDNHEVRDANTMSEDDPHILDLKTVAGSTFACGVEQSSEVESATDGKQSGRTRKLNGGRAAGVNSALPSRSNAMPIVWVIATWQLLVAAAR